ncbi:MAG TPA: AMP-binding protein, partial [Spirochaetales bacterium]|nr:AMP-binding protein [Spirochaetales bacterium]
MPAIFSNQADNLKDAACVAYKNAQGQYTDISWNSMAEMVRNIGYFLLSKGIKVQDKVALFSDNRYEWWVAELGILSA